MKVCVPEFCEYCEPWGSAVPGKARCCKEGGRNWGVSGGRKWRYSTVLGGRCVATEEQEQLAFFDLDYE